MPAKYNYINTKYIDCEAGDILYIPPLCVHKVDSTHPGTELQCFVFDYSLVPQSVACESIHITAKSPGKMQKIGKKVLDFPVCTW